MGKEVRLCLTRRSGVGSSLDLLAATVNAGLSVRAGPALAMGVVPPSVATLTQGVLSAMFLCKLKVAAVVMLTLWVLATGTGLLTQGALHESRTDTQGESEPPPPAQGKPESKVGSQKPAVEQPGPETRPISISGKASDSDGKPVRGATIYLMSLNARVSGVGPLSQDTVVATTTSDEQGRYSFRESRLPVIRSQAARPLSASFQIFGTAPGYGLTWQRMRLFSDEPRPPTRPNSKPRPPEEDERAYLQEVIPIDLTFRPAAKVQGRVVDEAGKPLGQVKVSLEGGLALDVAGAPMGYSHTVWGYMHALPESVRTAVTDPEGRFHLDGAPPDAVLRLQVEHPRYAAMSLHAATMQGTVPEGKEDIFQRAQKRWRFVTGDLALTFAASRQLTLQTVYGDTGQPLAGALVHVNRINEPTSVWTSERSDAEGKVQFRLPPGEYRADATPPAGGDYLRTWQSVTVAKEPAEQTAEVRVRRGCVLLLEAVDADTGKGIPGIAFLQESDNQPGLMRHLPVRLWQPDLEKDVTDAHGKLRVVVPPGKRRYAVDTRRPLPAGYRAVPIGNPQRAFGQIPRIDLAEGQTLTLPFELRK